MATRGISLLLLVLASVVLTLSMAGVHCQVPSGERKVTNLHFFFHDIVTGKNPSAIIVAKPKNVSDGVEPSFGWVVVIDDPMTEGPSMDSKVLGSAQGFYMSVGRKTAMLTMGVDYGFTAGPYNGSSFSVYSRNPVMDTDREVAVIGGRGVFRMAQGYALLRTHSISDAGDAVVEYNVTLFHY